MGEQHSVRPSNKFHRRDAHQERILTQLERMDTLDPLEYLNRRGWRISLMRYDVIQRETRGSDKAEIDKVFHIMYSE